MMPKFRPVLFWIVEISIIEIEKAEYLSCWKFEPPKLKTQGNFPCQKSWKSLLGRNLGVKKERNMKILKISLNMKSSYKINLIYEMILGFKGWWRDIQEPQRNSMIQPNYDFRNFPPKCLLIFLLNACLCSQFEA